MPTIFGVNIDEIKENRTIRAEHVRTIYGVLTGHPAYRSSDHKINFTGSIAAGNNNTVVSNKHNFAFGTNNVSEGNASFALGTGSRAYADNQVALSGGSITGRVGDSQQTSTVRSLVTTGGGESNRVEIPTQGRSISNIKVRIAGSVYGEVNSWSKVGLEGNLIFTNTRATVDESDDVDVLNPSFGSILNGNADWIQRTGQVLDDDTIEIDFEVDAGRLYLVVTDNRSVGFEFEDKFNWSIFINSVETYLGDIISQGYGYDGYSGGYGGYGGYGYNSPYSPSQFIGMVKTTEILMADGTYKKVEDIEIGDEIVSVYIPNLSYQNWDSFEDCSDDYLGYETIVSTVNDIWWVFLEDLYTINGELFSPVEKIYVRDTETGCFKWIQVSSYSDKYEIYTEDGILTDVEFDTISDESISDPNLLEAVNIGVQNEEGSFTMFNNRILVQNL